MDLIIRGGYVVDPSQSLEGTMDVEIARGRVRRVAPHIEPGGRRTLNAKGKIVTPGLVDLHCHFYEGFTHYGVNLEATMLSRGVTTAVDTGSAGAQTYPSFQEWFLDKARPTVRAYLNISEGGLLIDGLGENIDMRALRVDRAVECYQANRKYLIGMKVRLSDDVVERSGMRPLDAALEATEFLKVPLMAPRGQHAVFFAEHSQAPPPGRRAHARLSRQAGEHTRQEGPRAPRGVGGEGFRRSARRRPRALELQF